MQVIKPDVQDVSLPLSQLAKIPVPEGFGIRAHEAEPIRPIPHMHLQSVMQQLDPVVQNSIGGRQGRNGPSGPNIPDPIFFEGMGAGLGFPVQAAPPDIDGDIGPNHYVQIVDSVVTIFNRTGARVLGPINISTFFIGFPGACGTTNDGEGVVRYDRMADRWVISQSIISMSPFLECVAVSTTPDPTGGYARYQFPFSSFNDHFKMGLWPDAYYFTFNIFSNNQFAGARVCAFDRVKMLAGQVAAAQCFDTGPNFANLLASDLDGATLPPAGSPNFLVALDTNRLAFFKMHVDFATPANATFVGPMYITTEAFTPLCNGGTCVEQPGFHTLDSLADRLMDRLVYRRFSDHEALLVSHAVTAGTSGGVRFYELRNPATVPRIFQQGTYAPDSAFRWASSMAFDSAGNIGMGFAISSSGISPSIRYNGRLTTDALGTMGQSEASIAAGTGAQTSGASWAESSMNIDPTDDCTFWYMGKYIVGTGSFNWHTGVRAFTFRFNNTFNTTGPSVAIIDNTTITSSIPVSSIGNIVSLSLSLNITHTFRSDLVVKLISPDNTEFIVSNREGGSASDIIFTNLTVSTFNGHPSNGPWRLTVQDLAAGNTGMLNSWSITVAGNCKPPVHWSGSATPNLNTIDNGTVCTNLTVSTTGGDSSVAKLDISGSHDFRSILRGTLAHNSATVDVFPTGTFPDGSGTFNFTNRAVTGLSGDASGTWTFCIIDTDAFGDTGVLNTWSVHD